MKSLELALNSVSFGQIGVGLLREIFENNKNEPVSLFPISNNVDLSSFDEDNDFVNWIQNSINDSQKSHSRQDPIFKLWHLNGSMASSSKSQCLLTFYETDSPTETELNLLKQNDSVFVTSEYTKQIFETYGADNIKYLPLFFDKKYFRRLDKKFFDDGRIVFNVVGKLERRKNHQKVISTWAKKYGNDKRYYLNCAVFNPFLKPEENAQLQNQILEGKSYFNIKFHPFMPKNDMYNDFLNSGNITLGLSGGENWDLPVFHSVGIGKHAVILNCNGYKGWANNNNSLLINPNGKQASHDGQFFIDGSQFNQGNFFTFDEDEFIAGCDEAVENFRINPINEEGLKLQSDFSVTNTLKIIKEEVSGLSVPF